MMEGSRFERRGTVKLERMLYKSLSADLEPLLDWLRGINVINNVDTLGYKEDPTTFFKELRKGYILSKIGIVACESKREVYSVQVNSSPQTR